MKKFQIFTYKTNTYTLINKSQAVATVTGRAGWEALLRSKPAMVFGYPWYRDCPEMFKVKDVESCREALKKIINGYVVSQQQIMHYLKCFDNSTIHGYFPDLEKNSELTIEENRDNIVQKILLEIKT
ncbi:MAG: hypothetical protein Q8N88_01705 [Nanoarchaeota archaeon]|nr:hypothetical protein [Nanoarchaeota archaeon]